MSQKTYIDGAINHNNPCRVADSERKALWPEVDAPDVLLSIGTGSSISLERQTSERMSAAKKGIVSHGMTLFNILKKNMETALNCDRIWDDYFANVEPKFQPGTTISRYHRINPRLEGEVPALDEKDKMGQVRRSAAASLSKDPAVHRIARQLLATTFYLQIGSISDEQDGLHFVQGKIMCRLLQPSPLVRKLGKYLHHEMIEHGELSFVAWEQSGAPMLQRMDRQLLSQKVVEMMIREQKFEMDRFIFQIRDKVLPTHINLCFGDMTMVPISGFPRSLLLTADNHNNSPRISQSALPMCQTSLGAVTRAASRYTHGSRRLKRGAAWEPPSLQDFRSIPDLRQYGDPDRVIGLEVVDQQAAKGTDHESSLPEVVPVESKSAPVKQPIAVQYQTHEEQPGLEVRVQNFGFEVQHDAMKVMSVNSDPASTRRPITMQQRRPQEQPSARMTLRKAFRALLWPIRAHPLDIDNDLPEEGEDHAMSQFVLSGTGLAAAARFERDDRDLWECYNFNPGPLTMQYYEVDSVENAIYQRWVNLLGPSMGGAWVPLNQAGVVPSRRVPIAPEMVGPGVLAEMPPERAALYAPHPPQHMIQPQLMRHELGDTQVAELMDTSPRADLSDTALTPVDIISKHTHFGSAGGELSDVNY